ncbi:MAG: MjaI family restriction endonuclease [Candidatus Brocadiia bacterium]
MRFEIKFGQMPELLDIDEAELPKYTGTIINIANQWAQGTRPHVVGQMSDLIQEFPGRTFEEWKEWYSHQKPGAIAEATDRIWNMVQRIKDALSELDKEAVRDWAEDLVLVRTFLGLRFHEAIMAAIAERLETDYRLSVPPEESRGIDGYIGGEPVSIKPATYKARHHAEQIGAEIIYYKKTERGVTVEFDPSGL